MSYTIEIEGFEGQQAQAIPPGIFAGPKLLVNGQPAQKGSEMDQMIIRRTGGREVVAAGAIAGYLTTPVQGHLAEEHLRGQ